MIELASPLTYWLNTSRESVSESNLASELVNFSEVNDWLEFSF